MKKIIIGVSSLLMTLAGADALAQTPKGRAAQAAGRVVRGGEAAGTATTTTINSTARGTQISGNGVAQGAGAATANGTSGANAGNVEGSNLSGAAAQNGGSAAESANAGSALLDIAGSATRNAVSGEASSTPAGSICAAGGGFALSCDKFGPADQALMADAFAGIGANERGSVEALGRELAENLSERFGETVSLEDGIDRAQGLIEGGCATNI